MQRSRSNEEVDSFKSSLQKKIESVQISFSCDKHLEPAKNSTDDLKAAEICLEVQETERNIQKTE